jgi:hypothetical protein
MGEKELESFILSKIADSNKAKQKKDIIVRKDDARFILGKKMCEGTDPNCQLNENKGLNYIKDAIKAGHYGAMEY